jgi:mannose-1-phosphate guanylyltransferase/mannose-1-phosphate guanylyltransferase/mannose-6-phosphate isomerase
MFLFRADRYLEELEAHAPDILEAVRGAIEPGDGHGRVFLAEAAFAACRADSIDYAVMEPTGRAAVVPLEAGWHDVGSWEAVWELEEQDAAGNAVSGSAYLERVERSLVMAGDRPVAVIGLDDVIVVDTGDAVLVCARDDAQAVKEIVARLEADGRPEVERPAL